MGYFGEEYAMIFTLGRDSSVELKLRVFYRKS